VTGSVTAFDAPVTISGQVGGDVVVFNGRLVLRSGARVGGDVVTRTAPVVEPGATIGGERRRVQTNLEWDGFGWVGRFVLWLAISVSTLVVGLLFVLLLGRGAERLADAGRTSIGPAIGWGCSCSSACPSWRSSRWSPSSDSRWGSASSSLSASTSGRDLRGQRLPQPVRRIAIQHARRSRSRVRHLRR
jgi:hypothetical protein